MSSTECHLQYVIYLSQYVIYWLSHVVCCTSPQVRSRYNKTRLRKPTAAPSLSHSLPCLSHSLPCLSRRPDPAAVGKRLINMQVRRERNMHNTWQGGLAPHTSLIIHTSPTPTALRGATRLVCEAPLAVAGKYFTHSHWHGRKYFPAVIFIAAIRSFHLWSMSAVEMRVFSCWYMRASF